MRKKTKAKFRVFLSNKVYFSDGTPHVNRKITYFFQEIVKLDKVVVGAMGKIKNNQQN